MSADQIPEDYPYLEADDIKAALIYAAIKEKHTISFGRMGAGNYHISHKLLRSIDDLFPNSLHVWQAGLDRASDKSILDFAYERGYMVMTKDADFQDLYRSYTPPVKVIW
jgi:hypothetical protein